MLNQTNTGLLEGLLDPDNNAVWSEFCQRYRPVLVAFAQRLGVSEADAQDAAQETLFAFARAYREGKYDPGRGRLRSWLFGIAHRKVLDIQRRAGREIVITEEDDKTRIMDRVPDDHALSELWDVEWRRAIIRTCLEEIRHHVEPTTMSAFEMLTLQEMTTEEVCRRLDMTPNAVLKANRRVLSRMRELQQVFEDRW